MTLKRSNRSPIIRPIQILTSAIPRDRIRGVPTGIESKNAKSDLLPGLTSPTTTTRPVVNKDVLPVRRDSFFVLMSALLKITNLTLDDFIYNHIHILI